MKHISLPARLILPALLLINNPVVLAAEHEHQHREHGAHEHGTASLNIAIEDDSLYIELESPAMNIVGFEHTTRNKKQNQAVTQAKKALENATQQFALPVAAQCSVTNASVESPLFNQQHQVNHEEAHSEFHSSYIFKCEKISALNMINVRLFKTFKGMNDIHVQLISNSGQTTRELTTSQPVLVIKP